jgi:hypothetical protein
LYGMSWVHRPLVIVFAVLIVLIFVRSFWSAFSRGRRSKQKVSA